MILHDVITWKTIMW